MKHPLCLGFGGFRERSIQDKKLSFGHRSPSQILGSDSESSVFTPARRGAANTHLLHNGPVVETLVLGISELE